MAWKCQRTDSISNGVDNARAGSAHGLAGGDFALAGAGAVTGDWRDWRRRSQNEAGGAEEAPKGRLVLTAQLAAGGALGNGELISQEAFGHLRALVLERRISSQPHFGHRSTS